jgi:hypothetical protein
LTGRKPRTKQQRSEGDSEMAAYAELDDLRVWYDERGKR